MVTEGKPIFMFSAQEIDPIDPTDPKDRTRINKTFSIGWFSIERIKTAGVVVENFAFASFTELRVSDDRFRCAGKAAIEMTVIRSEHDPSIADDVNDMDELFLVGLAGEIDLAALQEFARLSSELG